MKVERECKIVSKEQVGDAVYMTLEVGDMIRASFRAPGQFVQIPALHIEVAGLLGLRLADAAHIPHFGKGGE